MKANPIFDAIRMSYISQGLDTENAVFSMLMTKAVKNKIDFDTFNIGEAVKAIHQASMKSACVNFNEGELVFQDMYEVHSVSGNRNEDGEPEVFIHMIETESMETHSVRIHQFPQIDWLLQIIHAVHNKCELTINVDEDED
jgi:predicted DNA-binding protein with PD1-like motif